MKPTTRRYASRVGLFATILLAICSFARPINSQVLYHGTLTLPYQTRWGKAVLPADEFLLTFTRFEGAAMLLVQDAKSGRYIADEPLNITEYSTKGQSALLIGTRGAVNCSLGQIFVCDRELARGHAVQEARQTQAVPVSVAKKSRSK